MQERSANEAGEAGRCPRENAESRMITRGSKASFLTGGWRAKLLGSEAAPARLGSLSFNAQGVHLEDQRLGCD